VQRRVLFKWFVPIVLLASILVPYTSRHFAGGAASLVKSLNDLNNDAFTLLSFANFSSSVENPSPVLSLIASFAADSAALNRAVEAKNATRAADLVSYLETDRAAVNTALAAHPRALPAKQWAGVQRKLATIVKTIPPVPVHSAEASKSTEEAENAQAAPHTPGTWSSWRGPPTTGVPSPKRVEMRVEQESFRDYTVRFFSEYFEILRNDKEIYRQEKSEKRDVGSFAINAKFLQARIDVAALDAPDIEDAHASTGVVKMGMNVTGNGQPDLVIDEWTGGAYCCTLLHIFEIGRRFRRIGTVDARELKTGEYPFFFHLDRGSDYQIVVSDDTFLFWRDTDHVHSHAPSVVLRYQGGHYRVAPDLMRRPAPTMAQLAKWAREERYPQFRNYHHSAHDSPPSDDRFGMGLYPGSSVWGRMLDLVYTGHPDLAWKFLDMVWIPGRPGKKEFLSAFRAELSKSPYWSGIRAMNSL
jgi:hypothetical protein